MDNYTMNVNKLLKSVLPGINEGYGHETPDNVSADQNRAIDALAQLGYTFNSWLASSNPEDMEMLKKEMWKGTENWDQLLIERAGMSGKLVLSDFTINAINKFKQKS